MLPQISCIVLDSVITIKHPPPPNLQSSKGKGGAPSVLSCVALKLGPFGQLIFCLSGLIRGYFFIVRSEMVYENHIFEKIFGFGSRKLFVIMRCPHKSSRFWVTLSF